jgi:L-ascorbate metabolism protein UlaG (beta-lactamase superfamily)
MKLTWHGHSAFRIGAGAAKVVIDPFLSDNPSWGRRKGSLPCSQELNTQR